MPSQLCCIYYDELRELWCCTRYSSAKGTVAVSKCCRMKCTACADRNQPWRPCGKVTRLQVSRSTCWIFSRRKALRRSLLQSLFPESIERLFCLASRPVVNTSHTDAPLRLKGVISGCEILYVHAIYPGFPRNMSDPPLVHSLEAPCLNYIWQLKKNKTKKTPTVFYDAGKKKKKPVLYLMQA